MGVERLMTYFPKGDQSKVIIKPAFVARYLIVDNMRSIPVYVYRGERIAIPADETPFDLLKGNEFKVILLPAGTTVVTLTYLVPNSGAAGYLKTILTDDVNETAAFHQTAFSGYGSFPSIGDPTDNPAGNTSSYPGSVIALLKRQRETSLYSKSTAASAAGAANAVATLTVTPGFANIIKLHSLHIGFTGAAPAAPVMASVTFGAKTLRYAVGATPATPSFGVPGLMDGSDVGFTVTLPAGGAGAIGVITAHYEDAQESVNQPVYV